MAVGPIPWSATVQWCEFYGLDHQAAKIVVNAVRVVDAIRMKAEADKRALEDATKGR